MFQGFIAREIRRTNRNLFLSGLKALAIPVAIGYLGSGSYWGDFFGGAKLVASRDLVAAPEKYIGRYVTIVGNGNRDLGLQEIKETTTLGIFKRQDISANAIALDLGQIDNKQQAILAKVKHDAPVTNTIAGEIERLPYDLKADVKASIDEATTLPIEIDAVDDFRLLGYVGLAIGAVYTFIGGSRLSTWSRQQQPDLHPISKRLSTYGQPEIVAQSIDRELGMRVEKFARVRVTDTWLLHQGKTELGIAKIADLASIYPEQTARTLHGIIPLGSSYKAICIDREGKKIEMPLKKRQVLELIAYLASVRDPRGDEHQQSEA